MNVVIFSFVVTIHVFRNYHCLLVHLCVKCIDYNLKLGRYVSPKCQKLWDFFLNKIRLFYRVRTMDILTAKWIVLATLFVTTFIFSMLPLKLISSLRNTTDGLKRARLVILFSKLYIVHMMLDFSLSQKWLKSSVFLDMISCNLLEVHWHFRRTWN